MALLSHIRLCWRMYRRGTIYRGPVSRDNGRSFSVHDDAHDAFMTRPGHTSNREDGVRPVVAGAMRLPRHRWGFMGYVGPGQDAHREQTSKRSVVLWRS